MATRKVKRYDDGGTTDDMYGDLEGAMDKANARAVQDQFDANEKASKPSAQKLRSVGDTLINKARTEAKAEAKSTTPEKKSVNLGTSNAGYDTQPAAKKEMYRTFGGKMVEKAPETDRFKGVRESIGSGLKSASEGVGNYLKSLGSREEKHGTYVKDGKVVRYAKGGMTKSSASSRADGIASKGKTRGKIC
jgi:hypothetical protein